MDYWKTYKHTHTQTGDYVIDMLLSCHNNGREMQTKQDRKKWLEKILQHSNTLYDEKGKKLIMDIIVIFLVLHPP